MLFRSFQAFTALLGLFSAAKGIKAQVDTILSNCPQGVTCLNGVNLAALIYADNNGTWKGQSPSSSDVALYKSLGFNTVRYAFSWALLQPDLTKPYDSRYFNTLLQNVTSIVQNYNMTVIVDCHMYGRYKGQYIGQDPGAPNATQFAAMWTTVARNLKLDRVMFALMNEPTFDSDPGKLQTTLQTVVDSLRAVANNATLPSQYLLLPSKAYQGIDFWLDTQNYSLAVHDPFCKTMIDLHSYFDKNGGKYICTSFEQNWKGYYENVTQVLRKNGRRAFMSEIGGRSMPACVSAINQALAFLDANSDVWAGYTAWGSEQSQPAKNGTPVEHDEDTSWTAFYIDCTDGDLVNGAFLNHGSIGCARARNQTAAASCCTLARDSLATAPATTGVVCNANLTKPTCSATVSSSQRAAPASCTAASSSRVVAANPFAFGAVGVSLGICIVSLTIVLF